jgi:hypothetical protein
VRHHQGVPTISTFYGIVIRMFFNNHSPAHFHALYGEFQATIEIDGPRLLEGELPGARLNSYWNGRTSTGQNYWKAGSDAATMNTLPGLIRSLS